MEDNFDVSVILSKLTTDKKNGKKYLTKILRDNTNNENFVIRCLSWLFFFDLFPIDQNIKHEYMMLIKDLKVDNWDKTILPQNVSTGDFSVGNPDLMKSINKDMVRTIKPLYFLPSAVVDGLEDDGSLSYFVSLHLRRTERILYTFGSTYKKLSYFQGFSYLVIPFYIVLSKAVSVFFDNDFIMVEAMTFQLMKKLLLTTDLSSLYVPNDDQSDDIYRWDVKYDALLRKELPMIHVILHKFEIDHSFYALRWVSLLFAQSYDMSIVFLLWDNIFIHCDQLIDYTFCMCIAKMKCIEDVLIKLNDRSSVLDVLQSFYINDMDKFIALSDKYFNSNYCGIFSSIKSLFKR